MVPVPPALIVAHPGHELRLHRWVETAHPTVFVLTDGSGSTGQSRLESTRRLVERLGARAGIVFGPLSDREIYDLLFRTDVSAMTAITLALGNALANDGQDVVVADEWEGYNPTHDVCRVVADLAVEIATGITGKPIRSYSYPVVAPAPTSVGAGDIEIPVDAAAWERKLASVFAYEELRDEANAMLEALGREPMRAEVLRASDGRANVPHLREKPQYEMHGEDRVADGRYRAVIRYDQHVAPFLRALITSVRSAAARRMSETQS